MPLRAAVGWSVFWISLGVGFSGLVYLVYQNHWMGAVIDRDPGETMGDGSLAVVKYLTAYVLEKSLSIDNIFVMVAVFGWFGIPAKYQHRVLFWGIIGAVIARALLLTAGVWVVHRFSWSFYFFGGILVFTGVRMLATPESTNGPEDSRIVRVLRRFLPLTADAHGGRMFARENGRLVVTYLALALLVIEVSDLVFAVDSVPAVLGVSQTTFIVVTSNVFAILGLRSLYFVLADMVQRFRHLGTALAVLLLVIGGKMLLHNIYRPPELASLGVVLAVVGGGIAVSLVTSRRDP